MARYRKKPVVIDAWHIESRDDARATAGICTGGFDCRGHGPDDSWPHVHTLEGDHTWTPGDWLIRGVQGELYFCKPDIFARTYEPAPPFENAPVPESETPP
jgi:hypothetical protein